jgi:hypothetical protein
VDDLLWLLKMPPQDREPFRCQVFDSSNAATLQATIRAFRRVPSTVMLPEPWEEAVRALEMAPHRKGFALQGSLYICIPALPEGIASKLDVGFKAKTDEVVKLLDHLAVVVATLCCLNAAGVSGRASPTWTGSYCLCP